MKSLKRILATALAVLMVAILPQANVATVKAAGTTYTVKYVDSYGEWRAQPLVNWDLSKGTGDLNYLSNNVKDGDTIVVVGDAADPGPVELKINVNIANLTLYETKQGVTFTGVGTVTDVYVLKGSIATLNANCKNIYVYDDSKCNVLKDADLVQAAKESLMKMSIVAVGKIAHAQIVENGKVTKDMYNVAADTFRIVDGVDKTDAANYSTTASASSSTGNAGNAGSTTTNNGGTVSPKTGEASYAIGLFAGAVLCFAGAIASKKTFA